MNSINSLFAVSEAFATARGVGEMRVSTLVFNDGKRLQRVRDGADIGARSIEKALQWFSDHWPESAVWPGDVPRPAPNPADSEAAE